MSGGRRAPTADERLLVEALPAHLRSLGLAEGEVRACTALVEAGLLERRRPAEPGDREPAGRVHPVVVARAVAAVVRPRLDPTRQHVAVRVAEATPTDLLRELRQRLRHPFSRRARRRGRRGRGVPADRG